jgi:hypothetical protein
MLLLTEHPQKAPAGVPQALIEEARERQRRRWQRRANLLLAGTVLALIGLRVVDHRGPGDSGVGATHPPRAALGTGPRSSVIFERIETVESVPHVPILRRIAEIWSLSDDPSTFREVVTIAGGPQVEIGGGPGHDAVLGNEQVTYLYDASTNIIYRTGFFPIPAQASSSSGHSFQDLIGRPDVRLVGTAMLDGHEAYVLREQPRTADWSGNLTLVYVDKRTNVPLMSITTGKDLRVVSHTRVWKTLPATAANRDLTSIARTHRGVQMLPASLRIKQLYGQAVFPPAMHA